MANPENSPSIKTVRAYVLKGCAKERRAGEGLQNLSVSLRSASGIAADLLRRMGVTADLHPDLPGLRQGDLQEYLPEGRETIVRLANSVSTQLDSVAIDVEEGGLQVRSGIQGSNQRDAEIVRGLITSQTGSIVDTKAHIVLIGDRALLRLSPEADLDELRAETWGLATNLRLGELALIGEADLCMKIAEGGETVSNKW